eukprot:1180203-Prorocentrum_minimum.AAC.1
MCASFYKACARRCESHLSSVRAAPGDRVSGHLLSHAAVNTHADSEPPEGWQLDSGAQGCEGVAPKLQFAETISCEQTTNPITRLKLKKGRNKPQTGCSDRRNTTQRTPRGTFKEHLASLREHSRNI